MPHRIWGQSGGRRGGGGGGAGSMEKAFIVVSMGRNRTGKVNRFRIS